MPVLRVTLAEIGLTGSWTLPRMPFSSPHRPALILPALMGALLATTALPARAQSAPPAAAAIPAENVVWLQIEALPTLTEAQERARAWGALFPDVAGFRLRGNWYGIALGPFASREVAAQRLRALKREGSVPVDAYVIEAGKLGQRYWPVGAAATPSPQAAPQQAAPATPPAAEAPAPDVQAAPAPAAQPEPAPTPRDETPEEARRAEAALDADGRRAVQAALQWFGHYDSAIDGAFGPGTRKAMASWQTANALDPTGILTTLQRESLVAAHQAAIAAYGFQPVTDAEAGIEATLPMAMLGFDRYEPPFARYAPVAEGGPHLLLISEPGDAATLSSLYDLLQGLEAVPAEGARSRDDKGFVIEGRDATRAARAEVSAGKGTVKGWLLLWNPAQDDEMTRVVQTLQRSFRAVGTKALDPGMVPMSDETRAGLMGGLEMRRPAFSRSGLYVDDAGHVLTVAEAVADCARITLDLRHDASVTATADGLALLTPARPLSPPAVASLAAPLPPAGAEVAVAGYGYEDQLPAATLTFGGLAATEGLDGTAGQMRLDASLLPGDAGGPVLDARGAVVGLTLPAAPVNGRELPPGVALARDAASLSPFLTGAGVSPTMAAGSAAPLPPEDLARAARGMTVLVSCWK